MREIHPDQSRLVRRTIKRIGRRDHGKRVRRRDRHAANDPTERNRGKRVRNLVPCDGPGGGGLNAAPPSMAHSVRAIVYAWAVSWHVVLREVIEGTTGRDQSVGGFQGADGRRFARDRP